MVQLLNLRKVYLMNGTAAQSLHIIIAASTTPVPFMFVLQQPSIAHSIWAVQSTAIGMAAANNLQSI